MLAVTRCSERRSEGKMRSLQRRKEHRRGWRRRVREKDMYVDNRKKGRWAELDG